MAHGALTPILGLRLLALAAGLRHNAEIGQPGLCFSAHGHKFGILKRAGVDVGRDRVKRLMRQHGLQGAKRRGKPPGPPPVKPRRLRSRH